MPNEPIKFQKVPYLVKKSTIFSTSRKVLKSIFQVNKNIFGKILSIK